MKPKKSIVLQVLAALTALALLFAGFTLYLATRPWYTDYPGPGCVLNYEGKSYRAPLRTWRLLSQALASMKEDPELASLAAAMHERMKGESELLIGSYSKAKEMSVHFISMIHVPFNPDPDFLAAVAASQAETLRILNEEGYRAIGCEGSWSDPLTPSALVDENMEGLKSLHIGGVSREDLSLKVSEDRPSRAYLVYQDSHPDAYLLGIEERELFLLHDKVNELMRTPGLTGFYRNQYEAYERVLVWFRTEIAVAKLISAMRAKQITKGVIVMGQNHRYQFQVIARDLGLKAVIHQTVPEKYRDDEAG